MKETRTLSKIKTITGRESPLETVLRKTMDHLICEILIGAVLSLVFHMNILSGSPAVLLASWAGSCLLMLFLEPLSLSVWGRTPGKAVCGAFCEKSGRKTGCLLGKPKAAPGVC